MERRMNLQEAKNDIDGLIDKIQSGEVIIIERDDAPELVIITHDEFLRLQAGQRNPDIKHPATKAGQRNPD